MRNAVIKTDMLKQPSIFSLLACAIRKSLGRESENNVALHLDLIGQYELVSKVKKTNFYNNFGIGIYRDKEGKKVIIKTWQGETKNFPYYSLINEYNTVKLLSEKIKSNGNCEFRVPNPIGYLKTENSLSVIFEYIDGKPLSKFPIKQQSRVISSAILFMEKLTSLLNKQDQKYLKKRGVFFYLVSLPVIFLYSFLLEKESRRTIFYSFMRTYFYSITSLNKELALAHGDLSPDNIFVTKSYFYILDSEHMKYTLAEYDLNYLSIASKGTKLLLHILKKRKDFTQDIFLCLYIGIQFSVLVDPKSGKRPYFNYLKI